MKFDHLILRKIITFVATRCHILTLKCNKFNFGWGSAPDPVGELTRGAGCGVFDAPFNALFVIEVEIRLHLSKVIEIG